ncbi:MAG: hypothetical protein PHQ35_09695 [Phycisphaerae bacterium]|nr:hypothetical protein [Phycisphaerae bacterium]
MSKKGNIAWDKYSIKFNLLSDKMQEHKIPMYLLIDTLVAYENLPTKYKGLKENYDTDLRHVV